MLVTMQYLLLCAAILLPQSLPFPVPLKPALWSNADLDIVQVRYQGDNVTAL